VQNVNFYCPDATFPSVTIILSDIMNHTFANFIVGPSNRLAYQAALAVANDPAAAYNPLLIRAGDSLGKSHLLHAIGHHLSESKPAWQTTYLTPDSLSHKLHNALQNGRIETLRSQYLKTDILLVDDIQDIAGKSYTQQTLLHTLDVLLNTGKQIVMASTITPQDITSLDLRLQSRLSCGVIVEIQPPELETRLAILRQKAAAYHISLPDSVASRIASNSQMNIRELENSLTRLATYASLHDSSIDDGLISDMLRQTHTTNQHQISVIQQTVASYFGVKVSEIKAKHRDHAVLIPRQIAMYLCQELTDVPLPEIGQLFGGRSTATVQHAYRRISDLLNSDAGLAGTVRVLRKTLVNTTVEITNISFPQA
jgi:chromosomal replication initiator protein